MNDSSRALEAATEMLLRVDVEALLEQISNASSGPSKGNGSLRRGEVPDPTFAAVDFDDEARKDLERVGEIAGGAYALASELTSIAERYQVWCRVCLRFQRRSLIDRHRDGAPMYRGLDRWCGEFIGRKGREPTREEVERRFQRRGAA